MDIQGKVALVTGAGSGIGRATALRLAAEGASVVVDDIDADGGRGTVRLIEVAGGRAAFVRADVSNEEDARAMIAFAEETFGGLDVLVNNAGVYIEPPYFPDADVARWTRISDVYLRGVMLGTQYGIEAMPSSVLIDGNGKVITTHAGFFERNRDKYEQRIRAALSL